jgi:hypothetical protein
LKYLDLFVSILVNSNYEASWAATSLINDLRIYFNLVELDYFKKLHNNLIELSKKNENNIEFIKDLILYIEQDVILKNN